MAVILDIGVMVILTLTCIIGYVKGFRKYFIGMIAAVIATAAAAYGSGLLAEPVYNRYMRDSVNSYVRNAIEEFDLNSAVMEKLNEHGLGGYVTDSEVDEALSRGGDYLENVGELLSSKGADGEEIASLRESIERYFGTELPESIERRLEGSGFTEVVGQVRLSSEELRECVSRLATQSRADAADYVIERAVKPVLTGVIRLLLFWICYAAVMLLLELIIFISGIRRTIPEAKAADRFAGLALGAIKGLLYCAVIAWVLSGLCSATENSLSEFNADIAERSYLFRYFFDYFYR